MACPHVNGRHARSRLALADHHEDPRRRRGRPGAARGRWGHRGRAGAVQDPADRPGGETSYSRASAFTWITDFYPRGVATARPAGIRPSSSSGSSRKREPGPIRKTGPRNQRLYAARGLTPRHWLAGRRRQEASCAGRFGWHLMPVRGAEEQRRREGARLSYLRGAARLDARRAGFPADLVAFPVVVPGGQEAGEQRLSVGCGGS